MRHFVTVLLSFFLVMLPVWAQDVQKVEQVHSLDEVKQKYPGAKMKMMTLEEYGLMKELYDDMGKPYPGTETVMPAEDDNSTAASDESNETTASEEDDVSKPDETASEPTGRINTQGHITAEHVRLDLPRINTGGNSDAAMVMLIVIGVIVVAVLVVYAGKYLYDVATSDKKYDYWMDMGWSYTYFSSNKSYNAGSMSGVKLATGFIDGNAKIGVGVEAGSFAFKFDGLEESTWVEFGGSYAMAGPHVRFENGKRAYFYLELLGGRSSHESVDTLAVGRFGINAIFGQVTAGVSMGALYMGLEDAEGIVQDVDNYETTTGVEIGYRF